MHDFLHPAEREWLGDAPTNLSQDHWQAAARKLRKDRLRFLIELHNPANRLFFERMPNDRAGLVMFDLDSAWPFLAAAIGPSQIAGQDIFRPLKPLKANDRRRSCFRLPAFDAAPGKRIDLLSRGRRLRALRAPLLGDAPSRVRHGAIELARIQAMHDTPSPTT